VDFVILDANPRKVEPTESKSILVAESWMNGGQVFKA